MEPLRSSWSWRFSFEARALTGNSLGVLRVFAVNFYIWLRLCRSRLNCVNPCPSTLLLAFLLAVTVWTYWGVRRDPYHFDDALFLQNPQVASPGDPWSLLKPSQSRQLTYLSFYLNYRLCGTRPAGYHIFDLFLHCLNLLGVYFFTLLVCSLSPGTGSARLERCIPLLAAAIFALHPVQSEAVNYVYQRSTLLATFFSLAALITFLLAVRSEKPLTWGLLSAALVVPASLSKETALVLPAAMLLLTWTCSSVRKERKPVLRPLLLSLLVYMFSGAAWVLYNLYQRGEQTVGLALVRQSFSYLAAQAQVMAAYLKLIFWPAGLVIDHAFKPAPLFSAWSLCCWILIVGLLAILVSIRRARPEVAFWGLAFFVLLAPSSSIIPSADLMFEHRLYLPMAAGSALLAWLLVGLCCVIVKRERARAAALLIVAGVALTACSLAARERTYVWGNNIRLWTDAVAKVPDNARAHYNLGVAWLGVDREAARREFLETLALQPVNAPALYNLGWLEQGAGRLDAARDYYEQAIRADPREWQAHLNLANLGVLQGRTAEAVKEYRAAIELRKDIWPAYESLASLQIRTGDPEGALKTLDELIPAQPDRLEARYLKAYALALTKRRAEAEAEIGALSARDPTGAYAGKIRRLKTYLSGTP